MSQSFKELIKYGLVGLVGLVVDLGAFFIFRDLLGINYIVSHILGSILAITNNFILNSYFTFKATDKILKRAISFFSIAGVGLALGSLILPFLVKMINISIVNIDTIDLTEKQIQNLAKLMTTVIIAFLQFFFNKYFTFKKKKA